MFQAFENASRDGWLKVLFSVACTSFAYLAGEVDQVLKGLIVFMVLDYITGFAAAVKGQRLSSKVGFWGIVKKVGMLILVISAHQVDLLLGTNGVTRTAVMFFLIANDGLSMLENLTECGLPIPDVLKQTLETFRKKGEAREGDPGA